MTSTRTRTTVVARDSVSDTRFLKVEIRTRGDGKNTQRQCCTGELEFHSTEKRFVYVAKEKRKPFSIEAVSASDSVQLKDRK